MEEYRIPNRAARRALAKKAGYIKKKQNASVAERQEMNERSRLTGAEIHRVNTERMLREMEAAEQAKEAKFLQELMETGLTYEEALEKYLEKKNSHK